MNPRTSVLTAGFAILLLLQSEAVAQEGAPAPLAAARAFFQQLSCAYYNGDASAVASLYDAFPAGELEKLKNTFLYAEKYQIGVKLLGERMSGTTTTVEYERFDQFLSRKRDLWSNLRRDIQWFKREHYLSCQASLTFADGAVKAISSLSKGCDEHSTGGLGDYFWKPDFPFDCADGVAVTSLFEPWESNRRCGRLPLLAAAITEEKRDSIPEAQLVTCPEIPEGSFANPSRLISMHKADDGASR